MVLSGLALQSANAEPVGQIDGGQLIGEADVSSNTSSDTAESWSSDVGDDFVEFSSSFLRSEKQENRIDVRRFGYADAVPSGEYDSDIYVNGEHKGTGKIRYIEQDNRSVLC